MLFPRIGFIFIILIAALIYTLHNGGYDCYFAHTSPENTVKGCSKLIAGRHFKMPLAHKARAVAYIKMGDNDNALFDLNDYIQQKPKDAKIHFARGLILYGMGYYSGATFDIKQSLENNTSLQAYKFLWLWLSQRRGGAGDISTKTLSTEEASLHDRDWPYPVIAFYLGKMDAAALAQAATDSDKKCETAFYSGEFDLATGDPAHGKPLIETAAKICPKNFIEYRGAVAELKRLAVTPVIAPAPPPVANPAMPPQPEPQESTSP